MLDENGKCDLNCPPVGDYSPYKFCCCTCKYKSESGCKLGDERPDRCKKYDCKKYKFYTVFSYDEKIMRWTVTAVNGIPNENCDKEFIDKYNELIQKQRIENVKEDTDSVSKS